MLKTNYDYAIRSIKEKLKARVGTDVEDLYRVKSVSNDTNPNAPRFFTNKSINFFSTLSEMLEKSEYDDELMTSKLRYITNKYLYTDLQPNAKFSSLLDMFKKCKDQVEKVVRTENKIDDDIPLSSIENKDGISLEEVVTQNSWTVFKIAIIDTIISKKNDSGLDKELNKIFKPVLFIKNLYENKTKAEAFDLYLSLYALDSTDNFKFDPEVFSKSVSNAMIGKVVKVNKDLVEEVKLAALLRSVTDEDSKAQAYNDFISVGGLTLTPKYKGLVPTYKSLIEFIDSKLAGEVQDDRIDVLSDILADIIDMNGIILLHGGDRILVNEYEKDFGINDQKDKEAFEAIVLDDTGKLSRTYLSFLVRLNWDIKHKIGNISLIDTKKTKKDSEKVSKVINQYPHLKYFLSYFGIKLNEKYGWKKLLANYSFKNTWISMAETAESLYAGKRMRIYSMPQNKKTLVKDKNSSQEKVTYQVEFPFPILNDEEYYNLAPVEQDFDEWFKKIKEEGVAKYEGLEPHKKLLGVVDSKQLVSGEYDDKVSLAQNMYIHTEWKVNKVELPENNSNNFINFIYKQVYEDLTANRNAQIGHEVGAVAAPEDVKNVIKDINKLRNDLAGFREEVSAFNKKGYIEEQSANIKDIKKVLDNFLQRNRVLSETNSDQKKCRVEDSDINGKTIMENIGKAIWVASKCTRQEMYNIMSNIVRDRNPETSDEQINHALEMVLTSIGDYSRKQSFKGNLKDAFTVVLNNIDKSLIRMIYLTYKLPEEMTDKEFWDNKQLQTIVNNTHTHIWTGIKESLETLGIKAPEFDREWAKEQDPRGNGKVDIFQIVEHDREKTLENIHKWTGRITFVALFLGMYLSRGKLGNGMSYLGRGITWMTGAIWSYEFLQWVDDSYLGCFGNQSFTNHNWGTIGGMPVYDIARLGHINQHEQMALIESTIYTIIADSEKNLVSENKAQQLKKMIEQSRAENISSRASLLTILWHGWIGSIGLSIALGPVFRYGMIGYKFGANRVANLVSKLTTGSKSEEALKILQSKIDQKFASVLGATIKEEGKLFIFDTSRKAESSKEYFEDFAQTLFKNKLIEENEYVKFVGDLERGYITSKNLELVCTHIEALSLPKGIGGLAGYMAVPAGRSYLIPRLAFIRKINQALDYKRMIILGSIQKDAKKLISELKKSQMDWVDFSTEDKYKKQFEVFKRIQNVARYENPSDLFNALREGKLSSILGRSRSVLIKGADITVSIRLSVSEEAVDTELAGKVDDITKLLEEVPVDPSDLYFITEEEEQIAKQIFISHASRTADYNWIVGPAGSGKSAFVRNLPRMFNKIKPNAANRFVYMKLDASNLKSKYHGDTEQLIRQIEQLAQLKKQEGKKLIIWIDEAHLVGDIEASLHNGRKGYNSLTEQMKQLLEQEDSNIGFIFTTTEKDMLDSELLTNFPLMDRLNACFVLKKLDPERLQYGFTLPENTKNEILTTFGKEARTRSIKKIFGRINSSFRGKLRMSNIDDNLVREIEEALDERIETVGKNMDMISAYKDKLKVKESDIKKIRNSGNNPELLSTMEADRTSIESYIEELEKKNREYLTEYNEKISKIIQNIEAKDSEAYDILQQLRSGNIEIRPDVFQEAIQAEDAVNVKNVEDLLLQGKDVEKLLLQGSNPSAESN